MFYRHLQSHVRAENISDMKFFAISLSALPYYLLLCVKYRIMLDSHQHVRIHAS